MNNLGDLLNQRILHLISGIQFHGLSQLYLSGNNIESVEVFHRIRMPEVKEIHLQNGYRAAHLNYISNISQLRKSCFPNLNYFGLRKNFFLSRWEPSDGRQMPDINVHPTQENLFRLELYP